IPTWAQRGGDRRGTRRPWGGRRRTPGGRPVRVAARVTGEMGAPRHTVIPARIILCAGRVRTPLRTNLAQEGPAGKERGRNATGGGCGRPGAPAREGLPARALRDGVDLAACPEGPGRARPGRGCLGCYPR